MNIFVGSLSFKTTESELQKEFEAFGEVDSVKIIIDRETLKSRGFAFVTMPNQEEGTAAIAALNGKQLNGFTLKVNEARPREPRGSAPRESGTGYRSTDRSGPDSRPPRDNYRSRPDFDRDADIYDTKAGRNGEGRKGRGGNRGSGGRPGERGRRSY